jgi:N-acetylmuramoyl-L-alanine amidase
MTRSAVAVVTLTAALGTAACAAPGGAADPLRDRVIVVDAGHGGTSETDAYRVGPGGEREEWINLRVAELLRDMLRERGARVIMTRETDVAVDLRERAAMAVAAEADALISIHHNATADPTVNFPIIYYHGYASRNRAGVRLAQHLARRFDEKLFNGGAAPTVASDHVIFPRSGTAVLRHSYGIPGVIGEASFFTDPDEEQRLRQASYNLREAEAYLLALRDFFADEAPPVLPHGPGDPLKPFPAAQEAERMSETALRWREDFEEARALMDAPTPELERAYELATRSVRSFPDSPVARDAHLLRGEILQALGREEEAAEERRRVREFYPRG